jgi:hypothetical protein
MFSSLVNRLSRVRTRPAGQTRRRSTRPALERLERRELPAAFTAGDLVVSRVGTGAGALTSSATATFLDEYNPATQALVQSIALPTSGSSLTEGGTFSSEGRLTAAADGHTLSIAGYQQAPGGAISGVNGVIGLVNPDGTVDTSTQIPSADLGSSESVRATAAAGGLGFWVSSGNFLRYVPLGNGGTTPTAAVSNYFPSPTAPAVSPAGQLYVDGGAGAQSNGVPAIDGPATIGTALPNNAGQTGSVLAGFPTDRDPSGNFPSSQQFVISPDGNTIFVADSRTDTFGGILEFFQSIPGTWTELGNLQSGSGADSGLRGLSADFSGSSPVLYAVTTGSSSNRLVRITGGTLDGSAPGFAFSTLATAAANEAFRGVAPVPTTAGATASVTTLTVTGDPGTYGTGDTLTATMDSTETGWVSFRQNGVEIGAAPLVSGTATFNTAGNLAAGTYNVVAVYTGDANFAPSTSSSQSVTINQATTTTTPTVAANPAAIGVPDTLTATLGSLPAGTAPTGTVTFTDTTTSTTLGTAPVSQVIVNQGGSPVIQFVATLSATFTLPLGTHNLSATYNGDANFATSTGTSSVTVVNATTTTVTTSDPNPTANPPSSVTLTAAVSSAGGTPTGTVEFFDDLLPFLGATITSTADAGGTVTVTAASNVPFSNGQTVAITGVNVAGYNGVFTISGVSGNTFQYTVSDPGLTNGSGGVAGLAATLDGTGHASAVISTALLQAGAGVADVLTPGLHSISAIYTPDAAGSSSFFTSTGVYEQAVQAQAFGTGDLFVYRVGDGQTPLIAPPANPNAGTAAIGSTVFVDEYTASGTLVQSIALPTADGGTSVNISTATEAGTTATITTVGPHGLEVGETVTIAGVSDPGYNGTFTITGVTSTTFTFTAAGGLSSATGGTASNNAVHAVVGNGQQSGTEQLSLSGDGHYLFLVGYDTNPLNTAAAPAIPTGPGSGSVARAVARIKYDGTVATVGLSGVQTGGNFNGVYSPDGHQFYGSGASGVSYFSAFVPTAALQAATATITSTNFTVTGLEAAGSDLVAIGASSNLVQKYTGFPTSAATLNALPGVSTSTDPDQTFVIDAFFTHLSGSGAPAGINTMYLSDDGPSFAHGEITKWALSSDGTTWNLVDHITAGTGNSAISFYWMAGLTDVSGNVTLYVTYGNGGNSDTGPGELYSVTDTNGWNAPIGTGGTHSDAAPRVAFVDNMSSEVFRGVAFAPSAPLSPIPPGAWPGPGASSLPLAGQPLGAGPALSRLSSGVTLPPVSLGSLDGGLPQALPSGGNRLVPGSIADGLYGLPLPTSSLIGVASQSQASSVDRTEAFFRLLGDPAAQAVGNPDPFGLGTEFGATRAVTALLWFDNSGDGASSDDAF